MSFRDEIQRHLRGEIAWNVPLANRTSLRVGGSADALLRPEDAEDLRVALAICRDHGVPVSFLGGGANTLLSDEGVEGVVVRLPVFAEEAEWDEKGATFTLGAGAPIARIPQLMRKHGLVGGEFLAGIPGTIGGATAMNAGTREGEFVRVVSAVELVSAEGARWFERDELDWTYRRCHLPEGGMVTRVRIRLRRADEEGLERSRAAMEADLGYRKRTQPLHLPASGSVFTNPPGDFAGRLIEAAGLKGRARGGARISPMHANWIVNEGGATASDVRHLVELAQGEVQARFGILLVPELRLLGRWQPWKT
ncbi:MAG: UDP-N-acetylmuramate dehydrogenase [Pseudomonadota bacterium]|nr:MAG: UDP-N-acetylmuramate dehydrogenase [Pseudomonadota bacterium]